MLFTLIMNKRNSYLFSGLVIIIFLVWMHFNSTTEKNDFIEVVKISLRDVGHKLLLSNQDSTSIVLPIKTISESKFELTFSKSLSFNPDDLVTIVEESIDRASLPKYYRVEVLPCDSEEISYSYEMKYDKEKGIIPCSGRLLPDNCYIIQLRFVNKTMSIFNANSLLYLLLMGVIVLLLFDYSKKEQANNERDANKKFISIGSFHFYPEQNKLVKSAIEISLSKKECELLSLFIAQPNQIIKRDELMKKVWEDHGVIVGRSLDTYISKLRKKLKEDATIKITNVHGVGYKLEIANLGV